VDAIDGLVCFAIFSAAMFAVTLLEWLLCRLHAKPCPRCNSQWGTELVGEWDGEQWRCSVCKHYWETR
jgi:hypothetical protein